MAVDSALSRGEPQLSETPAVRELLKLLVKAQKARRLYQTANAISDRLQNELFSKMSAHLDEVDSFNLSVREFQILLGEDVVYEGHDRNDSLAFLLFRDGIRRLSFHAGLKEQELQDFLKCLNRVALLSNEQDDLVTLFWEADFQSIKYYAVEELTTETEGPSLQEQLASGSSDGQAGGAAPADAVSLNVEQPIAHLPVEACRLEEEEIEALRAELAREEEDPFGLALVELAIELALLESSEKEVKALAEHLLSIVKRLLGEGDLEAVAQALEHLTGLTAMAFGDSEPVTYLNQRLVQFLAGSDQVRPLLERVESQRRLKPKQVTAYLAHLGKGALPALIEWMGRMSTAAYRRGVTEAVLASGESALQELEKHLPPKREVVDGVFLREVLFLLSHTKEDRAVALVERLLGSSDPLTRRETMQVLGRFRNGRVDEICLMLLADEDVEVRSSALDTLVGRGKPELARPILDHSLRAPGFDGRRLSEKRRVYAAVAKLGGDAALDLFAEQLESRQRRWFASRKEREACEAIVHGIRVIGTEQARRRLRKLADQGDRWVRAACLKALSNDKRA